MRAWLGGVEGGEAEVGGFEVVVAAPAGVEALGVDAHFFFDFGVWG